jgi:hypothetical protein
MIFAVDSVCSCSLPREAMACSIEAPFVPTRPIAVCRRCQVTLSSFVKGLIPGFRSYRAGLGRARASRKWRRHLSAQFQSHFCNLAGHCHRFETVTPCTGHGGLLGGKKVLFSPRKGRPRRLQLTSKCGNWVQWILAAGNESDEGKGSVA